MCFLIYLLQAVGIVAAVGDSVRNLKVGTPAAVMAFGGYAEFIMVPLSNLYSVKIFFRLLTFCCLEEFYENCLLLYLGTSKTHPSSSETRSRNNCNANIWTHCINCFRKGPFQILVCVFLTFYCLYLIALDYQLLMALYNC